MQNIKLELTDKDMARIDVKKTNVDKKKEVTKQKKEEEKKGAKEDLEKLQC